MSSSLLFMVAFYVSLFFLFFSLIFFHISWSKRVYGIYSPIHPLHVDNAAECLRAARCANSRINPCVSHICISVISWPCLRINFCFATFPDCGPLFWFSFSFWHIFENVQKNEKTISLALSLHPFPCLPSLISAYISLVSLKLASHHPLHLRTLPFPQAPFLIPLAHGRHCPLVDVIPPSTTSFFVGKSLCVQDCRVCV